MNLSSWGMIYWEKRIDSRQTELRQACTSSEELESIELWLVVDQRQAWEKERCANEKGYASRTYLFFSVSRCAHSGFVCTAQKDTREKRIQYQDAQNSLLYMLFLNEKVSVRRKPEGFPSDEGRALVYGRENLSSTICPLRQVRSGCC